MEFLSLKVEWLYWRIFKILNKRCGWVDTKKKRIHSHSINYSKKWTTPTHSPIWKGMNPWSGVNPNTLGLGYEKRTMEIPLCPCRVRLYEIRCNFICGLRISANTISIWAFDVKLHLQSTQNHFTIQKDYYCAFLLKWFLNLKYNNWLHWFHYSKIRRSLLCISLVLCTCNSEPISLKNASVSVWTITIGLAIDDLVLDILEVLHHES